MNKDEMSDDDAQFEAFLRGEGDLARQLQALAQPSPSAELDAAIVERARLAIVQQDREAANDPVVTQSNNPYLARGMGMRWRVPAGIAATVLAGMIGHQAFQQTGLEEMAQMPIDVESVEARMPSEIVVPAPAPMPSADAVLEGAPAAPPAAAPTAVRPSSAPVVQSEPVPPAHANVSKPAMDASESDAATSRAAGTEGRSAPAARLRQAPAPAPVGTSTFAAPSPPRAMERVTVTGSAIKRTNSEGASPIMVIAAPDVQAAPPPAPQATAGPGDLGMLRSILGENEVVGAAPAAPAPAAPAAPAAAPAPVVQAPVPLSPSRSLVAKEFDPAGWLAHIEALLEAENKTDAALEWARFRKAYPEYPVPESTEKRLKALPPPAEKAVTAPQPISHTAPSPMPPAH